MNKNWQEFLIHRGAELEDGLVAHFGTPVRERSMVLTGNIICDLSQFGIISVSGEDAANFLHNQFTNDVSSLQEDESRLVGFCNAKGRLIANMRIFKQAEGFYLRLPRNLVEPVIQRLGMYVLRSKVTLVDASANFVRIGYSGATSDKELAVALEQTPAEVNEVCHSDNLIVIRVPGITPSYEIYGSQEAISPLWTKLDVHGAPVGYLAWNLIEILAGQPHVLKDTTELFIPQMVNMQAIGGVSFTKGCYPGQEIVARMHYLGNLKKRMYLARVHSDVAPFAGQPLLSNKKESGSKTGHIVNAAEHPDGGYAVLAVIQIADAEETEIRLDEENGAVLELEELPYKVELKHENK